MTFLGMTGLELGLLIAALVIVLALAGYAGWLFWQVRQQRIKHAAMETHAADTIRQLGEDVLQSQVRSIKIITRLMLQDEMNITEGTIRLKIMLDHMLTVCQREPYQALYTFYDSVQHLAHSEARQALDKRERMKQDLQRMKLEAQHNNQVLVATKRLCDAMDEKYPDIKVIASAKAG